MKKLYVLLFCLASITIVKAQKETEDSVKAAVNKLFVGMALADSSAILNSFTPGAVLESVVEKDGQTSVRKEQVAEFAHSIGSLQKSDADEQIKFNTIKIDGPLALVWTPYNFFYKGKFSHCGVDCFVLVRINNEWKIQYLTDTRRKTGCKY